MRKETCADVAREIGLGEVLKLGRSEMLSGGRRKEALLGDAMEAVIAAVYLDAGFEAAQGRWSCGSGASRIGAVEPDARDAKTALQEWAQARGMPPPTYTETGPRWPGPPAGVHRRGDAGQTATPPRRTAGSKRRRNKRQPSASGPDGGDR